MKRSKFRKILCTLLAGAMLLTAMTGCKSAETTTEATPTAEEISQAMTEAMESVNSFTMTTNISYSMTEDGEEMVVDSTSVVQLILDPFAMKMVTEYDDGEDAYESAIYYFKTDGVYTMYMGFDDFWMSYSVSEETVEDVAGLSELEEDLSTYTLQEEKETINGVECYVLVNTLAEDAVLALADMTDYGYSTEGCTVEVVYYVDSTTFLPVRVSYEMGEAMEVLYTQFYREIFEDNQLEVTVDYFTTTCDFSDFNAVEEIVLPDEAQDSISLDDWDLEDDTEVIQNEDGTYSVLVYDEEVEVLSSLTVAVPQGYNGDDVVFSTTIYFELDTEANAFGYVMYCLEPEETAETIQSSIELWLSYYEDYTEFYENCTYALYDAPKTLTVNGMEISYLGCDLTADGLTLQEVYAWTMVDGVCIYINAYNEDYSELADSGVIFAEEEMEGLLQTLFEAVVAVANNAE